MSCHHVFKNHHIQNVSKPYSSCLTIHFKTFQNHILRLVQFAMTPSCHSCGFAKWTAGWLLPRRQPPRRMSTEQPTALAGFFHADSWAKTIKNHWGVAPGEYTLQPNCDSQISKFPRRLTTNNINNHEQPATSFRSFLITFTHLGFEQIRKSSIIGRPFK